MTELEILAQLKMAYLSLEDISENHGGQLTENEGKYIRLSMQNLEILYGNIYKRIMHKNNKALYYKENIKIGDCINIDYTIEDTEIKEAITYNDMENGEKWWEDFDYLSF
jgi:hypothetical protein